MTIVVRRYRLCSGPAILQWVVVRMRRLTDRIYLVCPMARIYSLYRIRRFVLDLIVVGVFLSSSIGRWSLLSKLGIPFVVRVWR